MAGELVELTATEYSALYELAVHALRVLSYSGRGDGSGWARTGGATAGVTKGSCRKFSESKG